MRSIGFRAEKELVRYVVLEGTKDAPQIHDEGKIDVGEKRHLCQELVMLRTELLNLFNTHKPTAGAIKLPDNPKFVGGMQAQFSRCRLEGVIMLAAGEYGIPLHAGPSGTIKKGVGVKKKSLKEYAANDIVRGCDLSARGRKSDEYRDAFYSALAALGGK